MVDFAGAWKWAGDNPGTVTALIGLLTTCFNWLAKPRTAEEYAAMSPRRAAMHRWMAAVFPDPAKAIEAVWQFAKNTHDQRPPPPNPPPTLPS